MTASPPPDSPVNPQKSRTGLSRILHATGYSLAGVKAGWSEKAFRQEVFLAVILMPAAFFVGQDWVQIGLLGGSVMLVLIVELLNTALESAIDRISPQWHALSKRAKDMGSAAVLLSLLWCFGLWAAALWSRWGGG